MSRAQSVVRGAEREERPSGLDRLFRRDQEPIGRVGRRGTGPQLNKDGAPPGEELRPVHTLPTYVDQILVSEQMHERQRTHRCRLKSGRQGAGLWVQRERLVTGAYAPDMLELGS